MQGDVVQQGRGGGGQSESSLTLESGGLLRRKRPKPANGREAGLPSWADQRGAWASVGKGSGRGDGRAFVDRPRPDPSFQRLHWNPPAPTDLDTGEVAALEQVEAMASTDVQASECLFWPEEQVVFGSAHGNLAGVMVWTRPL